MKRKVEHKSFTGDGYHAVLEQLNDYLSYTRPSYRLVSVQETNVDSRLATETTYEWFGTYLIAWEQS